KTSWYTFVAPMVIGGIIAGAPSTRLIELRRFATALGTGFQIQDDILNLTGAESLYGKEIAGDLWAGEHTLILVHALRRSTPEERAHAIDILGRPRPVATPGRGAAGRSDLRRLVADLHARGHVTPTGRRTLERALGEHANARAKSDDDIRFL